HWRAATSTRQKTQLSTMTSCPTRSAAWERSLKGGLLPAHDRLRRGREGSRRKVDVRRRWEPRVEKTARTTCLEEMPITRGRHYRLFNSFYDCSLVWLCEPSAVRSAQGSGPKGLISIPEIEYP